MVKGRRATRAFAALLPSLALEGQALVLGALGARGDSTVYKYKKWESHGRAGAAVGGGAGAGRDSIAVPAVAAFTKSPHEQMRLAAIESLEAVRAALGDANEDFRGVAVRTLSEWPDAALAEELLALARTSSNETHKVLALRGYVRMAGMSKDPTAIYVRAMELAERLDDKKLVLGGLGSASGCADRQPAAAE